LAERRGLVADSLIALILGGALLVASLLALGPPDVGLAGQFLSGSYPSMPTAVACLSLLCYAAVVSAAAVAVIGGARTAGRGRGSRRTIRGVAFILAGAVLLCLSVVNRIEGGSAICCGGGSPQAQEVSSLVR